jgi:hypothetical protein
MTDRLGALAALVNAHSDLAAVPLDRFHALFKDEALVIDKWFTLQVTAPEKTARSLPVPRPDAAPRLHAAHAQPCAQPADGAVPEQPGGLPSQDAAGYVFWADRVIEIDASTRNWRRAWLVRWTTGVAWPSLIAPRPKRHSSALLPRPSCLTTCARSSPALCRRSELFSFSSDHHDQTHQPHAVPDRAATWRSPDSMRSCACSSKWWHAPAKASPSASARAPWVKSWAAPAARTCRAKSRRSSTSSPTKC